MYDKFVAAAERALRRTSTIEAPWTIVEGVDEAYRSLTVAKSIRDAIRKALAQGRGERQTMKPRGRIRTSSATRDHGAIRVAAGDRSPDARILSSGADDPEQPRHVAGGLQEGLRD